MCTPDDIIALERTFSRLRARIEKLEGVVAQLRIEQMHPGFFGPSKQQFQALDERVKRIEILVQRAQRMRCSVP